MEQSRGRLQAKVGAWMWVFCCQFFLAEQIARLAWRLPYSFARNYVSDLGAVRCGLLVCSPLRPLMNASFVLQGVLIAGGTVLLWRGWSAEKGVALTLMLFVLCGAGVVVVGLAPEDMHARLHGIGAAVHFLCGAVGMLVAGVLLLRKKKMGYGWISVGMGAAVLFATVLLGMHGTALWERLGWGAGTVERVAAYGIPLWFMGMGTKLLTAKQ